MSEIIEEFGENGEWKVKCGVKSSAFPYSIIVGGCIIARFHSAEDAIAFAKWRSEHILRGDENE